MKNFSLVIALMLVAMVVVAPLAQSQDSTDCVAALMPCTQYFNSTTEQPSKECCNPLTAVLKSAFTCVCSIIGDAQFVQVMGYNFNATTSLPMRCGVANLDLVSECKAQLTPPAPAPGSPTTPSDPSMGPTTSSTGAPIQSPATAPGASAGSKTTILSGIAVFGSFLMAATMMF